jgi:hypothetical protein
MVSKRRSITRKFGYLATVRCLAGAVLGPALVVTLLVAGHSPQKCDSDGYYHGTQLSSLAGAASLLLYGSLMAASTAAGALAAWRFLSFMDPEAEPGDSASTYS